MSVFLYQSAFEELKIVKMELELVKLKENTCSNKISTLTNNLKIAKLKVINAYKHAINTANEALRVTGNEDDIDIILCKHDVLNVHENVSNAYKLCKKTLTISQKNGEPSLFNHSLTILNNSEIAMDTAYDKLFQTFNNVLKLE
jgi:hypothetical protein